MIERLPLDLAAETIAYQAYAEGHRACPFDEDLEADMLKAKAQMERAWLAHCMEAA